MSEIDDTNRCRVLQRVRDLGLAQKDVAATGAPQEALKSGQTFTQDHAGQESTKTRLYVLHLKHTTSVSRFGCPDRGARYSTVPQLGLILALAGRGRGQKTLFGGAGRHLGNLLLGRHHALIWLCVHLALYNTLLYTLLIIITYKNLSRFAKQSIERTNPNGYAANKHSTTI